MLHCLPVCSAFHSTSSLICNTAASSPQPRVMVLMEQLNQVLSTNKAKSQLRVQAGMDMKGLLAAATAAGMSVPLIALPDYLGLSVGGVIATGATGTGQGTGTSCLVRARVGVWREAEVFKV